MTRIPAFGSIFARISMIGAPRRFVGFSRFPTMAAALAVVLIVLPADSVQAQTRTVEGAQQMLRDAVAAGVLSGMQGGNPDSPYNSFSAYTSAERGVGTVAAPAPQELSDRSPCVTTFVIRRSGAELVHHAVSWAGVSGISNTAGGDIRFQSSGQVMHIRSSRPDLIPRLTDAMSFLNTNCANTLGQGTGF